MAYKFGAEQMTRDDLELSDYDKQMLKARIELNNRKWFFNQAIKWIGAILFAIFILKVKAG